MLHIGCFPLQAKERHIVELVSDIQAISEDIAAKDELIARNKEVFTSTKTQLQVTYTTTI